MDILTALLLFVIYPHQYQATKEEESKKCGLGLSSSHFPQPVHHPRPPPVFLSQQPQEPLRPFKALFILPDHTHPKDRKVLEIVNKIANDRLGKIIKGPVLKDIRYSRPECNKPRMCVGATIPDEFVQPCPGEDSNISSRVAQWNDEGRYTMVVYAIVHGPEKLYEKHLPGGAVASAGPCDRDEGTRRWTRGLINWYIEPRDQRRTHEQLESILMHELLHVIICDLTLCTSSEQCDSSVDSCENVTWSKIIRDDWLDDNGQPKNEPVFMATSPNLRSVAQAFFGCDDIEGIELNKHYNETSGEWQIDPYHWSERMFTTELLHPVVNRLNILSILTLAVINQTGWYEVDMTKAEHMDGPMTHGCDVAKKQCKDVTGRAKNSTDELDWNIAPFCNAVNGTDCSNDGKRRTICNRNFYHGSWCDHVETRQNKHPICEKDAAGTTCVTITKFKKHHIWDWVYTHLGPTCLPYTCQYSQKAIEFSLDGDGCEFKCEEAEAYRYKLHIFENGCHLSNLSSFCPNTLENGCYLSNVSYFCPNYTTICKDGPMDPSSSTSRSSTTTQPIMTSSSIPSTGHDLLSSSTDLSKIPTSADRQHTTDQSSPSTSDFTQTTYSASGKPTGLFTNLSVSSAEVTRYHSADSTDRTSSEIPNRLVGKTSTENKCMKAEASPLITVILIFGIAI